MDSFGIVERPGALCTVQDLGRPDGRRAGLSPGGAMDQQAFLWANRLLGNDPGAPMLEVALGDHVMRFRRDTTISLAGADCRATIDGAPANPWRTVRVFRSQRLRLGFARSGVRAYIGFPGGLDVPSAFGSASAVMRDALPGLSGRPLKAGEAFRWHDPERVLPNRYVPSDLVPQAPQSLLLPLITGYEWRRFHAEDRALVFTAEWKLDPASDRTAALLAGPALHSGPKALDSVPLVSGTVQVTGDGTPLVFMRDRPTIGGYAKLGSVGPLALDRIAQATPGTSVRFFPADATAIRKHMVRREAFFGRSLPC